MLGVIQGFVLILVVIGAGYLAARTGVVQGDQRRVLNNVAFYIATPALLFVVLAESDPEIVFSPVILITTVSALFAALLFIIASRLWFRRDLGTTTLGAASSSYVNANNLGLPVAVYILGDAAYVAPLLLVQLLFFAPVVLALLEAGKGTRRGIFVTLWRTVRNPIIIGSVLGAVVSLIGVEVPTILRNPLAMIGDAAIPLVLMSFGASLYGQRALQRGTGVRAVFVATFLKLIIMPAAAWVIATALGLGAHEVFVATTISALPAAQNLYNYAVTYRQGEVLVRDTVFLTTFASLPVIAAIAWLLG